MSFGISQNAINVFANFAVSGRKPKTIHDVAIVKDVDDKNNTTLTLTLSRDVVLAIFGGLGQVVSAAHSGNLALDVVMPTNDAVLEAFPEATPPEGADFWIFATQGSGLKLRLRGTSRTSNHSDPSTFQEATAKLSLRCLTPDALAALHDGSNPLLHDVGAGPQLVAVRVNPDLM